MMEHEPINEGLVKVAFDLDPTDWHGFGTETMWAERIEDHRWRLRNVPFYVRGVSLDDLVDVDEHDGALSFRDVAERGGHSTYRIFLTNDRTMQESTYWQELESLGCTYERATRRLFAVDVPPSVDIYTAYAILEKGQAAGEWDFEEGNCGHSLRESPSRKKYQLRSGH